MAEEAYIEGWRSGDPLGEIRKYRAEIAFTTVMSEQKGGLNAEALVKAATESLKKEYNQSHPTTYMEETLENVLKSGQLARDAKDKSLIVRGPRW